MRTITQEHAKDEEISWEGTAEALSRNVEQEGQDLLLPKRSSQRAACVYSGEVGELQTT